MRSHGAVLAALVLIFTGGAWAHNYVADDGSHTGAGKALYLRDVTLSQVQSQRFSLTRKIHCWDAMFTRSFVPGGEAEYYFRLGVRDQKEIYFERGTRAQSFGGIQ